LKLIMRSIRHAVTRFLGISPAPLALSLFALLAASAGPGDMKLPREPIYPGQVPREVSDAILDARELVMRREYRQAERLLWKLTRSRPADPSGPTALMVVYQVRMLENEEFFLHGEMERVMEINRRALARFGEDAPRNTWYYTMSGASLGIRAVYHLWRDEYILSAIHGIRAIGYMRRAGEMNPRNWEARMGLGLYIYYRSVYAAKVPFLPASMDRREHGIREVRLAGRNRLYLYETSKIALCRIHMDGGRYEEARRISDELIDEFPHFLVFYLFSARSMYEAGNYARAAPYYRKAYRIDPGLPFAPYRLGRCYEELGRPGEAEKWYARSASTGNPAFRKWNGKAEKRLEKLRAAHRPSTSE